MATKQTEAARKAAALKAKAKPQPHPQLTPREIAELNRKAKLAADAFADEREEQEREKEPRLLTKKQVCARVCLTYPTIWKWMREGRFPRSRNVGGKAYWLEGEISAWILALPRKHLKGDPEPAAVEAT